MRTVTTPAGDTEDRRPRSGAATPIRPFATFDEPPRAGRAAQSAGWSALEGPAARPGARPRSEGGDSHGGWQASAPALPGRAAVSARLLGGHVGVQQGSPRVLRPAAGVRASPSTRPCGPIGITLAAAGPELPDSGPEAATFLAIGRHCSGTDPGLCGLEASASKRSAGPAARRLQTPRWNAMLEGHARERHRDHPLPYRPEPGKYGRMSAHFGWAFVLNTAGRPETNPTTPQPFGPQGSAPKPTSLFSSLNDPKRLKRKECESDFRLDRLRNHHRHNSVHCADAGSKTFLTSGPRPLLPWPRTTSYRSRPGRHLRCRPTAANITDPARSSDEIIPQPDAGLHQNKNWHQLNNLPGPGARRSAEGPGCKPAVPGRTVAGLSDLVPTPAPRSYARALSAYSTLRQCARIGSGCFPAGTDGLPNLPGDGMACNAHGLLHERLVRGSPRFNVIS